MLATSWKFSNIFEEGMETKEETKGTNVKLILPTLMKNSMNLDRFYVTSKN